MSKRSAKKQKKDGSKAGLLTGASLTKTIESWTDAIPKRPNRTQMAQVFISSLNGYPLKLSDNDSSILSDFRKYLARQIEKNFRFLSADINEEWTATGAGSPRRRSWRAPVIFLLVFWSTVMDSRTIAVCQQR